MKIFKLLSLAIIVCLAASCGGSGGSDAKHDGYVVKGTIANAGSIKTIYLDHLTTSKANPIDTAELAEDGTFKFIGSFPANVPDEGIFRVRLTNSRSMFLIMDKTEKIDINADFFKLENYVVMGSPRSAAHAKFSKEAVKQQRNPQYVKNYIDSTHALNGVMAINFLRPEDHAAFHEQFGAKLRKEMPGSEYSRSFDARLKQMAASKATSSGGVAPDISGPDLNGKVVSLSDLKGQVVLLDFWASWCRPCRSENPNVVKAYEKYKDKGFTVFNVSLDKNKKAWEKAIKADGLVWDNHASNLKGWGEPMAKPYSVSSIPRTFLIDKEGKIVAKNLRGAALDRKLEELFGAS